jgi:hypothetical protein
MPHPDAVILEKQLESKDTGGAQRSVDGGENSAHGRPAARQIQGDVKINDAISKQEIAQSAPFVVE